MAGPSSSQRDRSGSHHHHRTISSTTLLLVLSLILAVLAVMLALPRAASPTVVPVASPLAAEPTSTGILNMFSAKRDSNVVARESAVAVREAEIARREADLLAGIPAGVTIGTCLPCAPTAAATANGGEPTAVTIFESISPPWWKDGPLRMEDVIEREARISAREKEVGTREEVVGRRESDAARREAWIVDHLMGPPGETPLVETEEYVIENGRRSKELPPSVHIVTETETETVTLRAQQPAHTRLAAQPAPEEFVGTRTEAPARTTAFEAVVVETPDYGDGVRTVTVVRERGPPLREPPRRWFGNW